MSECLLKNKATRISPGSLFLPPKEIGFGLDIVCASGLFFNNNALDCAAVVW